MLTYILQKPTPHWCFQIWASNWS